MLKSSSKRKRTHAEVEEVKDEEEELKHDKQTFLKAKKQLTHDLRQKELKIGELQGYEGIVHQLFAQGLIDQSGQPIIRAPQ
jgi:signal transduction histidine kinase